MNPAPEPLTALAVHLHGRPLGTIARLAGHRHLFSYEQSYIDHPLRPTFSLSARGRAGGLLAAPRLVRRRLPPWFANLLPEGHLRSYLAARAGVHPQREFFLLAALGADLPGAVTVAPLPPGPAAAAPPPQPDPPPSASPLRFSLAGVQLKFSAILEARGGLTIPASGVGGAWIVKLPSQTFDAVSENEFVMLELARAIGIPVPRLRLVPVAGIQGLPFPEGAIRGQALAVERFDRAPGGRRIHMEDFAQVFGQFPEDKYRSVSYANIARVLWAETGEPGAYDFIRRLAFSVLIGNGDMHLKNWSLLYPDTRTPVLAPAYDFVSTLPYLPAGQLALSLGGSRDMSAITLDQLRRLTDKAALPTAPVVRLVAATAEATLDAWQSLPAKDLLPPAIQAPIDTHLTAAARATLAALKP